MHETTEADRVGVLRNGRPQCRSHSRLSKGEQTINIFGVNTHTSSPLSSRGSGNCAACQEQNGNMSKTELCDFLSRAKAFRHCSASGPSGGTGGSEPHAGAVQGCPQTKTSVLSATTARESTITRHVWGLSFARLPKR